MTTEKSGFGVDQEGSTASSSATTEATGLRAYGVTVRRVELRVPVPRTTFDVIVNCGLGRWNAEMVADRIRGFLREALDRGYAQFAADRGIVPPPTPASDQQAESDPLFTREDVDLLRHAADYAEPRHPELCDLANRIEALLPRTLATGAPLDYFDDIRGKH